MTTYRTTPITTSIHLDGDNPIFGELRFDLEELAMITKVWAITEGRRHYKAIAPNGAIVSISHTSSCPFYLKHVVANLKRVEGRAI